MRTLQHNPKYGFRKSKAVKGLGVALIGMAIFGTQSVNAQEESVDIIEDASIVTTADVSTDHSNEIDILTTSEAPSMVASRDNEGQPLVEGASLRAVDTDLETTRNKEYYDFYIATDVDGTRAETTVSEWVNKDRLNYLAIRVGGTNEVIEDARIEFNVTNAHRLKQYSMAHPDPSSEVLITKDEATDSVTFSTTFHRLVSGQDIKLPFNLAWKKYVPDGDVSNLTLKFFDGNSLLKENRYEFRAKTLNLRDFKLVYDKAEPEKYDANGDPYANWFTTNDKTNNDPENVKPKSVDPTLNGEHYRLYGNKNYKIALLEESMDQGVSNEEYLNMVWDGIGVGPEFVDTYYFMNDRDKDMFYSANVSMSHKQFSHNYSDDLDEARAIHSSKLTDDVAIRISKLQDIYSRYGTAYKMSPGDYHYDDNGYLIAWTDPFPIPIPLDEKYMRNENDHKVLMSHENLMNLIKANVPISGGDGEFKNESTTLNIIDANDVVKPYRAITHKNPNVLIYKEPPVLPDLPKPPITGNKSAPSAGSVLVSNLTNFFDFGSITRYGVRLPNIDIDHYGGHPSEIYVKTNGVDDVDKRNNDSRLRDLYKGNHYGTNTNLRIHSKPEMNALEKPTSINNLSGDLTNWAYTVNDANNLTYTLDYYLDPGVNFTANPPKGLSVKDAQVNPFQKFEFLLPRLFNQDAFVKGDESSIDRSLDAQPLANVRDGAVLINNLPERHIDAYMEFLKGTRIDFFNEAGSKVSANVSVERTKYGFEIPGPDGSEPLRTAGVVLKFDSPGSDLYKYMTIDIPKPDDSLLNTGLQNEWYYMIPNAEFLIKGELSPKGNTLGTKLVESVMSSMYVVKDEARNGLLDGFDYEKDSNWSNVALINPNKPLDLTQNESLIPKRRIKLTYTPVLEVDQTTKFVDGIHTVKGSLRAPVYESILPYANELSDYVLLLSKAWDIVDFQSEDGLRYEEIKSEETNEARAYRLIKDDMSINIKGSYLKPEGQLSPAVDLFNFTARVKPNDKIKGELSFNGEYVSFVSLNTRLATDSPMEPLVEDFVFDANYDRPDINKDGNKSSIEADVARFLYYAQPLFLDIRNLNGGKVTNDVPLSETVGTVAGENLTITTEVGNKTGVTLSKPIIVTTIPKANDSTVLGDGKRGSQFDTVLVEAPQPVEGYTIYYSTEDVTSKDATAVQWSDVAPSDLSMVRAVSWRANDGVSLVPDKKLSFKLVVKTPEDAFNNARLVSTSAISVNDKPYIEGYRTVARVVSPHKVGSVVVDYFDTNGVAIKPEQPVLTDSPVDTAYTTETVDLKPAIIHFEGKIYHLKEHKATSDAPSGSVIEGSKRVTYIYELPDVVETYEHGDVIVHYVSDDATPLTLKEDVVNTPETNVVKIVREVLSSGRVVNERREDLGVRWSLLDANKPQTLPHGGYTYAFSKVKDGDLTEGVLPVGRTEVTLIYTKPVTVDTVEEKGSVRIHWISTNGVTLKDSVLDKDDVLVSRTVTTTTGGVPEVVKTPTNAMYDVSGMQYERLSKDGVDYAFIKVDEPSDPVSGLVKSGEQIVTFVYAPITEDVVVELVKGDVIAEYYAKDTMDKLADDAVVKELTTVERVTTTTKHYVDARNQLVEVSRDVKREPVSEMYDSQSLRHSKIEKDGISYRYVGKKVTSAEETGNVVAGRLIVQYEYEPIKDGRIPNDYPTWELPSVEFDIPNDYPTIDKPSIEFDIPNDYPTIEKPSIEFDIPNDYPTIEKPSIEFDVPNDYPTTDKPSIEFDIPNDYPTTDKPSIEFDVPNDYPTTDKPSIEFDVPNDYPTTDKPSIEFDVPNAELPATGEDGTQTLIAVAATASIASAIGLIAMSKKRETE